MSENHRFSDVFRGYRNGLREDDNAGTPDGFSTVSNTAKITVISPNFLVWKFCGKTRFPYSFGRFAPENKVKLRYFSQCHLHR